VKLRVEGKEWMRLFHIGLFLALLGFVGSVRAATVKLRDGTVLSGKIVNRSESTVTIEVDGMPLEVQTELIDSIDGGKVAHPQRKESPPIKEGEKPRRKQAAAEKKQPLQFPPKPPYEEIIAHARAKARVIRNPDPERVAHISDKTFFGSINPDYPGMKAIVSAARARKYESAWQALDRFARKNWKPVGILRDVEEYYQKYGNSKPGGTDSRADQICNHVIRVWHTQVVDFGKEMDWTNVKGRSSLYGFHYWGWSSPLWSAYIRTGNEKYAAGFDELFTSWYAQREKVSAVYPTNSIIWYELGCARARRFLRLFYAMRNSRSLRPETRRLLWKTLLGHANQLQAMEECGYTDGNFQLTASGMLYQLGLTLPFFKDAPKWRRTATERLIEHAYWDFSKEGGHNERCVGYGGISMRAIRQLLIYADDDPEPTPLLDALRDRVLQMQLWFLKYVAPNGVFTGVNDSGFHYGASMLIDLAKFAKDGRFLYPIRDYSRLPEGMEPKEPEFLSVHMPDSGWTFMRDGWDKDSFYLQVNWGRYGSGHTHPGLLDINAYAFDTPMVIETGRFGSYDNPLEPYFRSPEAHNQVTILDCNFDRRNHQGENVVWRSGKRVEYFEGLHRGYEDSAAKIIKRQILFVKGEYWLVIDTILDAEGAKTREARLAALNWHSPFKWRETDDGLTAGREGGPGVQLLILPRGKPQFQTGYENTVEMYKNRYRAYYTQAAKNGAWFVTLISPYKEKPLPCKLELLKADSGAIAVRVTRSGKSDRFIARKGEKKIICAGDLLTDGRAAWLREQPLMTAVVDGSKLIYGRRKILSANSPAGLLETE